MPDDHRKGAATAGVDIHIEDLGEKRVSCPSVVIRLFVFALIIWLQPYSMRRVAVRHAWG